MSVLQCPPRAPATHPCPRSDLEGVLAKWPELATGFDDLLEDFGAERGASAHCGSSRGGSGHAAAASVDPHMSFGSSGLPAGCGEGDELVLSHQAPHQLPQEGLLDRVSLVSWVQPHQQQQARRASRVGVESEKAVREEEQGCDENMGKGHGGESDANVSRHHHHQQQQPLPPGVSDSARLEVHLSRGDSGNNS